MDCKSCPGPLINKSLNAENKYLRIQNRKITDMYFDLKEKYEQLVNKK